MKKKIAFIFPGQGAQYLGMGQEFYHQYPVARQTFEEAEDLLNRSLTSIIFGDSQELLTQTANSQVAIYVVSWAIRRVLKELYPEIEPDVCGGLSLGEYTALSTAGYLDFGSCLGVVQRRAELMNEACERTKGTMAVVLGLSAEKVEELAAQLNLPNDLWVANFNCPGQVVLSGTEKGIVQAMEFFQQEKARVRPLQVHGAFHSGLMRSAEEGLAPTVMEAPIVQGHARLVMNVPGDFVEDLEEVKKNLIRQVTESVRWEQSVRTMDADGVDLYVEIECGKVLSGFNRKIQPTGTTVNVEGVEDLQRFEEELE